MCCDTKNQGSTCVAQMVEETTTDNEVNELEYLFRKNKVLMVKVDYDGGDEE